MGIYQREYWLSDTWGMNRQERRSGVYHPYIPDTLSGVEFRLTPEAASAVSAATADVAVLNASSAHLKSTESLARLILRSEAIASSRIEGLEMNAGKLLEYEALDELGVSHRLDATEASVLANISAMRESIELGANGRITVESVCAINRLLLAHTDMEPFAGQLRTQQNWIGGNSVNPLGAAYVPPKPEYLPALMDDLALFAQTSELPAVAVAALVHAQLETIHPFVDGNGRTGRALVHAVLRSAGLASRVVPPVSLVLATDKRRYIANLAQYRVDSDHERRSQSDAASDWVEYFARALSLACARAADFERTLEELHTRWVKTVRPRGGSAAEELLAALVDNPVVSVESAARLTGKSREAARNAIAALREAGVLTQNARNRKSNIFMAHDVLSAFTHYERALATPSGNTAAEKPVRPVPQRPPRNAEVERSRELMRQAREDAALKGEDRTA